MRWSQIVQLAVVAAIVAAATTAVAVLIPWLPVNASEQRDGIDFTFWLATGICIFIFAVVCSVILFSVWKFRARADDDTDGPPIHGHTGLEIAWTAVPALLVTVIAIAAAVVLTQNSNAGNNPLRVTVTAPAVRLAVRVHERPRRRQDGGDAPHSARPPGEALSSTRRTSSTRSG